MVLTEDRYRTMIRVVLREYQRENPSRYDDKELSKQIKGAKARFEGIDKKVSEASTNNGFMGKEIRSIVSDLDYLERQQQLIDSKQPYDFITVNAKLQVVLVKYQTLEVLLEGKNI
jgi:hypothetical protein